MEGGGTSDDEVGDARRSPEVTQELSQLAMDDAGEECGGDLRSVVLRIGAPLLPRLPRPCDREAANDAAADARRPDPPGDDGSGRGRVARDFLAADLRRRNDAVRHRMGSMAQCRGAGGDALREAGAVGALLDVLWRLVVPLHVQDCHDATSDCSSVALLPPTASQSEAPLRGFDAILDSESLCNNHLNQRNISQSFDFIVTGELDMTAIDLAVSCLGSLRDLSCGSASNRAAVLSWVPPSPAQYESIENGVHLLSSFVKRYHKCKWEDILCLRERGSDTKTPVAAIDSTTYTDRGKKELRLLTNALGAIRNTSHSMPDGCQEFFNYGLVDLVVWRLMPDDERGDMQPTTNVPSSSLPQASQPWREACFRAAGSLINLAEKCPDVARCLGSNRGLIYLLIEAWGGAGAIVFDPDKPNASKRGQPLLHLGLAAILHAAGDGALKGGLDCLMLQVLEKEKVRKRIAQKKEEERKRRQMKQKQ